MTFDNIRQAVLDAAHKEAGRILEAARKTAEAKLKAGDDAARQEIERRYQAETRAIEEDYARALIQFRGAANKQLLELRNRALHDVFARVRRNILEWPPDEYARVMRGLVERAIANAEGRLRVHPEDFAVFRTIVGDLSRTRPSDQQVRLDESDPLASRGGFVFVGKDYEVDQTLDALLADLEHDMSPQIAAELFRAKD